MTPVHLLRPATLSETRGPAMFFPFGRNGEVFAVTGAAPSMAVFLDGTYAHEAFPCDAAGNWNGIAIEGVEIEVDLNSIYDINIHGLILGSVIRAADAISIVARVRSADSFKETRALPIIDSLPLATERLQAGFKYWQAVIRNSGERHVIYAQGCSEARTTEHSS